MSALAVPAASAAGASSAMRSEAMLPPVRAAALLGGAALGSVSELGARGFACSLGMVTTSAPVVFDRWHALVSGHTSWHVHMHAKSVP